jgi:hypothetical protein
MRVVVFYLLASCLASPVWAGAWMVPEGDSKATLQYGERKQPLHYPLAPEGDYMLRETYQSLLLEHGLSRRITILAKLTEQKTRETGRQNQSQNGQLALQIDAPKLATGLLPPFVFSALETLFPKLDWQREKIASLRGGLDWQSSPRHQSGYHVGISLADKITLGRVSVLQEVEFSQTRLSRESHVNGQYRFSILRGDWQIGSQAEQFENETTGYLSLKHSSRLTWKPQLADFEITLGRGHSRVNNRQQPLARFLTGQQWTLEFQQKF